MTIRSISNGWICTINIEQVNGRIGMVWFTSCTIMGAIEKALEYNYYKQSTS